MILLFGLGAVSGAVGSGFSTQFEPPAGEATRGLDILEAHFDGAGSGFGGRIVFLADQGVADPDVQARMSEFFQRVDDMEALEVQSPYEPGGQAQVARSGDLAGKLAFAQVEVVGGDISVEEAAEVSENVKAQAPEVEGLRIEYGGQLFAVFAAPESEVLGLGFAIIILILSFGSVMAMGLPLGTAFGGIGVGVAIVALLSNVLAMPDFTTTLGVMIGLGVGIDYALFIVTRYREGLHHGFTGEHATGVAINTAGRAVLFAGITVVISLMGMLLMGLAFVRGLAIGAATVVALTMVASVTLLPALLGFVGDRVERTRVRGLVAAGLVAVGLIGLGLKLWDPPVLLALVGLALLAVVVGLVVPALRRELPRRPPKPVQKTLPYRWSRVIQRHPWAAVTVGTLALLVLAVPLLSIRLGFSDEGNAPEDTSTRQAYDLLAEGFGPGFNGPFVLASLVPEGATPADSARISDALSAEDGVAAVIGPIPSDFADPAASAAVVWQVVPESAPQDKATSDLLTRLRDDVLPTATAGNGFDVAVTGSTAISADFSTYLGDRMPLFIGVVLALSFLLLMSVFRSLLVPVKAVIMNLISIGSAYGLIVAVFQWGWLADIVGIGKGGPIEPFIPMMMFAIVFGLSMDYEVFLLSRIKEEYDRGSTNDVAVADGLANTARVITAAAAIMVVVFGSFLLESDRIIKVFGVGLASAVLLDATIVRMLLVPATMELLGDRNWWLPGWIGRLLPNIDVEGTGEDTMDDAPDIDPDADPRPGADLEPAPV